VAGALVVPGSRALAHRFVFPVHEVHARGRGALEGATEHLTTATDGVPVRALELVSAPDAPVVVHFHNNRETAEESAGVARELHRRGLGVVLVEYRGYGARGGGASPSEDGLYADAEAVLSMLAARGIGPQRVILWGTSLGTGVAAEMARRGRGAGLVLVTPYTSIPDLVTDVVPFVPARVLVAERFDTLEKASAITVPTLVVHGDADEIVPFHMGARLAATIPGAQLLAIRGGHHGDLFLRAGAPIVDAISRVALSRSRR
jgi:fermentation-respiration switch protein FrsA (DUF1100 family)